MIFAKCALLNKHFAFAIEYNNADSAVQQPFFMGFKFAQVTKHNILFVLQVQLLLLYSNLPIFGGMGAK